MRRILVLLYIGFAAISCLAYLGFLYFVFGCDGFVAFSTKQHDNNEVLFSYGLFRRRENGPNNHSSCKVWTYESILGETVDGSVSLRQMQLGQTAAILGLVSSTLYLLLVSGNICFRIPIPIMKKLGGSLSLITLLMLAAMLPPAVSMPFCDVSNANSFIECHLSSTMFYVELLLWLFATIGVTYIGDDNVDRVLCRRRNNIEMVSETSKDPTLNPLEEGIAAPTLDDILMIHNDDSENADKSDQINIDPNGSLDECVRSMQLPAIENAVAEIEDADLVVDEDEKRDPIEAVPVHADNGTYS